MKLWLKVADNRILDARFKTQGCSAAIATSSYATEMIIGMDLDAGPRRHQGRNRGSARRTAALQDALLRARIRRDPRSFEGFRMIAVAMSGGVDSSAAAVVLRDAGEEDRRPVHAALESAPRAERTRMPRICAAPAAAVLSTISGTRGASPRIWGFRSTF